MALSIKTISFNYASYTRAALSGAHIRWSSEAPPFELFVRRGGEKFQGYTKKPFPYKNTPYGVGNLPFDRPMERYTSQSKVIIVEGTVGIGKNEVAKRIANEFDLHYQRGVQSSDLWINRNTLFDYRLLNEVLDEEARHINFKDLMDSDELYYGQVERMQANVMENRIVSYALGLLHMFSTGQGFTGVRSPWSDTVMADTMWRMGWVTPGFAKWHRTIPSRVEKLLLRPHLHVYLHCPAKIALEKIRHREANDPSFVSGKNLDLKYLEQIEERYKRWLDSVPEEDGEAIHIDWSGEPDEAVYEEIFEEIQNTDLDGRNVNNEIFSKWAKLNNAKARNYMFACANPTYIIEAMYQFPPWYSIEFRLPYLKGLDYTSMLERHPMVMHRYNEINGTQYERYLKRWKGSEMETLPYSHQKFL